MQSRNNNVAQVYREYIEKKQLLIVEDFNGFEKFL
jgi:hypothetical protein